MSLGEIVYFEMDFDGLLVEYDEKKEMFGIVICLSFGEVLEGRVCSFFLVVGCDDCIVCVLSLDDDLRFENKFV